MTEARNTATSGSEKSESRRPQGQLPQQLTEAGRQIQTDARQLAEHVSEAGSELQTFLADTARERPIATIAVAAGIGYLLGGGLSSRLSILALGAGTRLAMAVAAREMGNWATQSMQGGQGEGRQGSQGQQGQRDQQGQRQQGGQPARDAQPTRH